MTYYAARLSFFKPPQTGFVTEKSQDPPIILAEKFLISGPDHIKMRRISPERRYVKGQIEFYIGNVLTEGSRLIAFKIGKKKLRPRGTHSKKTFREVEEEHYPASTVLWSAESQIIFIEKPKKDQMSVNSIITNIQYYLNGVLLAYGYAVSIAPLTHKSTFWDVVDNYDKIYSVEFRLFAPNLLDFSKTAKDLVKSMKDDYNANETSIRLSNDNGKLLIPKEDNLILNLLEWIAAGAGKWFAKVDKNGKKSSINSDSGSKKLDKDLPEYDVKTAKNFTSDAVDSVSKP